MDLEKVILFYLSRNTDKLLTAKALEKYLPIYVGVNMIQYTLNNLYNKKLIRKRIIDFTCFFYRE